VRYPLRSESRHRILVFIGLRTMSIQAADLEIS
jgi:hypothetical protein